jgi:hypothetical protein
LIENLFLHSRICLHKSLTNVRNLFVSTVIKAEQMVKADLIVIGTYSTDQKHMNIFSGWVSRSSFNTSFWKYLLLL